MPTNPKIIVENHTGTGLLGLTFLLLLTLKLLGLVGFSWWLVFLPLYLPLLILLGIALVAGFLALATWAVSALYIWRLKRSLKKAIKSSRR